MRRWPILRCLSVEAEIEARQIEAYSKARKPRGLTWGYWTPLAVILTLFPLPQSARLTSHAALPSARLTSHLLLPQVFCESLCW